MLANFSFDLSRVHLHIGGGFRQSGAVWVANCKSNFRDVTTEPWPLRGDVSFLNQYPAEIKILPFSVPDIELDFYQTGLAKRIAQGIEDGYPTPVDALGIQYLDAKTSKTDYGLLGIVCGIERSNYDVADKMLQRHLGRSDLICNVGCTFHGFNEAHYSLPDIPTRDEFMTGSHYFATASKGSITFYPSK
ncbi:MAG: hypothetical protein JO137_02970 [Hyphomicrobiales bacterium]|nr:hypothetical protein [Hyphomicrobiales bacterium]MBV9430762.1 hypothetical protein [Hyphomicrobiales bacterium]MBV9738976.1 hypothetical protein [Hyphomicrobiales bacterium]